MNLTHEKIHETYILAAMQKRNNILMIMTRDWDSWDGWDGMNERMFIATYFICIWCKNLKIRLQTNRSTDRCTYGHRVTLT